MTDITSHLFWITSRAAGISAMLLASLSVGLGLSMAARLGGRLGDRRALHEALSLGVMVSLAVHALALVGDGFLSPSVADVLVPLQWDYETFWTTLGIVHAIGMGTDAGQPWFLALLALAVVPPLALLAIRVFGSPSSRPHPRPVRSS